MKSIKLLLLTIGLTIGAYAQNDDPVVLTIDGDEYKLSEFVYIYTKNNKNPSFKKKDLNEYMNLFIDYKLKVKEAKRLGYDTIPQLKNELAQYRKQLAQPYLIDKSKNEALVKQAYDRTKNEVRASHLLVKISQNASPDDTLKAYNKIMDYRKQIMEEGADFTKMAKEFSEDPSAKTNGGDLGYFTALQMVYPFEETAFNTPVGEVSMPIRTRFGYHLIYVHDKRPSRGKIEVKHIMIVANDKMTTEENEKAKTKIDEIYTLLKEGQNFDDLAKKYSDDKQSAVKGGLLPMFGAGTRQRMVPEFEKAAFELKNDGDFSEPIKTAYGWHIIQRVRLEPVPSYDKMHKELQLKVEKDIRSEVSKQSHINTLKKDYNFSEDEALLKSLNSVVNKNIFAGRWTKPETIANGNKTLFNFSNVNVTLNDFVDYLHLTQKRVKPISIDEYINKKYNDFVNYKVLEYEDTQLETKYPQFKTQMQEYEDGILIFEIMQKQIWQKASNDSTGLKNYYDTHKEDFMYPIRYKGTLYTCNDKETAAKVYAMLKAGEKAEDIIKKINADSQLNLNYKTSTFNSKTTREFTIEKKKLFSKKTNKKYKTFTNGVNKPYANNGNYYIMVVDEILKPEQREFKDSKGLVTAAYQDVIQDKWLNELRDKANITINKKTLKLAKAYYKTHQ
ncbi:MAG TPA: peptidyl-prolyl cis-trans isomerase [Crocinitomix sp.]|nr:peptidyl-prolyl cis-trans isomerase [Crocinitomix sp.]